MTPNTFRTSLISQHSQERRYSVTNRAGVSRGQLSLYQADQGSVRLEKGTLGTQPGNRVLKVNLVSFRPKFQTQVQNKRKNNLLKQK